MWRPSVRACVRKQSRTVAELLLVQYEYTTRRVRRYEYSRTSTVDPSPPPAYSTRTVPYLRPRPEIARTVRCSPGHCTRTVLVLVYPGYIPALAPSARGTSTRTVVGASASGYCTRTVLVRYCTRTRTVRVPTGLSYRPRWRSCAGYAYCTVLHYPHCTGALIFGRDAFGIRLRFVRDSFGMPAFLPASVVPG